MDEEFVKRIIDFFTAAELVDALDVSTEDLVPYIEELIEERLEAINEYLE